MKKIILLFCLLSLVANSSFAANYSPIAVSDSASVTEGGSVTINVLSNDSDPNGDAFYLSRVWSATHGRASRSGNSAVYRPNAGYTGSDSFSYTINDGNGRTSTASVSISVNPRPNGSPRANSDALSVQEGSSGCVNVLSNDSDPDNDSIRISNVWSAAHGRTSSSGSSACYTPNAGYTGSDSFSYTINDGRGKTASANVSVTVYPIPNRAPRATADAITADENKSAVCVNVLINDWDPDGDVISITNVWSAANGRTSTSGSSVCYTPNTGFSGNDSFNYTIRDGRGETASASVSVTVTPNGAPRALADEITADENRSAVCVDVLINDWDPDDDVISIANVWSATNGITSTSGSSVCYTPNTDFSGDDSFDYTIRDSRGKTASASVSVTVTPNGGPRAIADEITADENKSAVCVDVLINDWDPDDDVISIANVWSATNGITTTSGSSVCYTPNTNFSGDDSFDYTIRDSRGKTGSASVGVTVLPNGGPRAIADTMLTKENNTDLCINVLVNDWDPDDDALTLADVWSAAHGSTSRNGNTACYHPNPDYSGEDSFRYTIRDSRGKTASIDVLVTIAPTMVVNQFEWIPSPAAVGAQTSFYWQVENAETCYSVSVGSDTTLARPAFGGGETWFTYDEPEEHLTRWYCLDEYDNRFPEDENTFIETVRIIVPSRFESVTTELLGAPITTGAGS